MLKIAKRVSDGVVFKDPEIPIAMHRITASSFFLQFSITKTTVHQTAEAYIRMGRTIVVSIKCTIRVVNPHVLSMHYKRVKISCFALCVYRFTNK